MYGAFDVVLYFVNPTVLVAIKLTSYLILSYEQILSRAYSRRSRSHGRIVLCSSVTGRGTNTLRAWFRLTPTRLRRSLTCYSTTTGPTYR